MIWDLLYGLFLAGISFVAVMILCAVIGRTAGYFSRYKSIS